MSDDTFTIEELKDLLNTKKTALGVLGNDSLACQDRLGNYI